MTLLLMQVIFKVACAKHILTCTTVYITIYIYIRSFSLIYNVVLVMIYKKVLFQYYVNKIKTKDFDFILDIFLHTYVY